MTVLFKPKFKIQFFDRSMIKRNFKRINNNPLARASAIVMRKARGSIKRRGQGNRVKSNWDRKASPAGSPPFSWGRGTSPPFKMIRFAPAGVLGSAFMVGMIGFGGATPTPELMEHGGSAPRTIITQAGFKHQTSRKKHGRFAKRIKGKRVRRVIRYPKRPFMFPALISTRTQMPHLWRNSIRKGTVSTRSS